MLILNLEYLCAINGVLVMEVELKIEILVLVLNRCNFVLVFALTVMMVAVLVGVLFLLGMLLVLIQTASENMGLR